MQRIEKNNNQVEKFENNKKVIEHLPNGQCGTFTARTTMNTPSSTSPTVRDCTCPAIGPRVKHISSTLNAAWCAAT